MKKKPTELGYGENLTAVSAAFVTTEVCELVNSGMSRDLRETAEVLELAQVGHKVWATISSASARAGIERIAGGDMKPR